MSCEVTKTALRAEIPALKGKTIAEAYAFFQPIVGEPDDIDHEEGTVDFFVYEGEKHRIAPVKGLSDKSGEENRWGIETILSYENGYGKEFGKEVHTLQELAVIGKEFIEVFGAKEEDIRLYSYTYYTGADEPIKFE